MGALLFEYLKRSNRRNSSHVAFPSNLRQDARKEYPRREIILKVNCFTTVFSRLLFPKENKPYTKVNSNETDTASRGSQNSNRKKREAGGSSMRQLGKCREIFIIKPSRLVSTVDDRFQHQAIHQAN